jgi:hypothetical protein
MARLVAIPHDETVRLLLKINARFPYIPIFPPSSTADQPSSSSKPAGNDLPVAPPAAAVSTVTEPQQDPHQQQQQQQQQPPPENHYDGYETDPPAHYPKPGNGLARTLPPESEDVPWLLDDNFDVFQQIDYRGQQQQAVEASTTVPVLPETNGGQEQATAGAEGLANVDAS